MHITFLGTGTSVGVPMIGCSCAVCTSADPRNRRRRSSLYLEAEGTHLVIDTPPDFRDQVLEHHVPRVDAVLFTHAHADHILGFDDIRRFNTIQDSVIPAYGCADTLADVRRIFDYVDHESEPGVFRPRIDFQPVSEPFDVGPVHVTPLPVIHGNKPTYGYRLQTHRSAIAYVPDCLEMPADTLAQLDNLDIMILDGLRHRPHKTHLTLEASLALLNHIHARQSYVTHICHDLDHQETEAGLPETIHLACDGLNLQL